MFNSHTKNILKLS